MWLTRRGSADLAAGSVKIQTPLSGLRRLDVGEYLVIMIGIMPFYNHQSRHIWLNILLNVTRLKTQLRLENMNQHDPRPSRKKCPCNRFLNAAAFSHFRLVRRRLYDPPWDTNQQTVFQMHKRNGYYLYPFFPHLTDGSARGIGGY